MNAQPTHWWPLLPWWAKLALIALAARGFMLAMEWPLALFLALVLSFLATLGLEWWPKFRKKDNGATE